MPTPTQPTLASDLSALDDASLTRAVTRAYREAARSWSEYRAEPNGSAIKRMLLTSAEAAEAWWQDLNDEAQARLTGDEPTEVRSSDVYTIPLASTPVESMAADRIPGPVTSPWVRRAERQELPSTVSGPTTDRRIVR